jgi:hypothetical protein
MSGMILREAATHQTLDNTADFVGQGLSHPQLGERAGQIISIMQATDPLVVSSVDVHAGDMPTYHGLARSNQRRRDYWMLPPTAVVFQALPGDREVLPPALIDAVPGMDSIIDTTTPCALKGSDQPFDATTIERQPHIILFANLKHPRSQAIVGAQAFCQIALAVHGSIPVETPDSPPPLVKQRKGRQIVSVATIVPDTIKIGDDIPATEWVDASLKWWQNLYEGNSPTGDLPEPPADSPFAEARQQDPVVTPLMDRALAITALRDHCRSRGLTSDWLHMTAYEVVEEEAFGFPI